VLARVGAPAPTPARPAFATASPHIVNQSFAHYAMHAPAIVAWLERSAS